MIGWRRSECKPGAVNEGGTSLRRDDYASHDAVTLSRQSSRTEVETLIQIELVIARVPEKLHRDSSVFQSYNVVSD